MAVNWPIGYFNRPWMRWSYDEALDGMRDAGVKLTGLLGNHEGEPFILAPATDAYLDDLKARIEARGLTAIMAWLQSRHDIPLEDSIADSRGQIDRAARLGLKYLLSGGVHQEDIYNHYYRVMADAAAYAGQHGIQIVLKPHGGNCASADEILTCMEEVDHPNFKVWYDAGNIIHYTGKDPNQDVKRVVHLVTGFCAKDCGELRGDVMIQFGDGKVDFATVFGALKEAGFDGPVMIECCAGQTPAEVTANARANREFLEEVFDRI